MEDNESQEDELLALSSIYDETVFHRIDEDNLHGGKFTAHPELTRPFYIITKGKDSIDQHEVEYLPPLILHFQLPSQYPSKEAPIFTLSCKWLNREQLSRLCKELDRIWEEEKGNVVLYRWTEFLTSDSLKFLGITTSLDVKQPTKTLPIKASKENQKNLYRNNTSTVDVKHTPKIQGIADKDKKGFRRDFRKFCGSSSAAADSYASRHKPIRTDRNANRNFPPFSKQAQNKFNKNNEKLMFDKRAIQDLESDALLLHIILEFDQRKKLEVFNSSVFSCKICFSEKQGINCLQFKGCNHIYCKECLKNYFEIQIRDGNVQNLNCPEEKCQTEALPSQVRDLVSPELYSKYDQLLLANTLNTMADIMYCPRISCQCAVMLEKESTMAHCPACCFVFCIYCKMAYHGIAPCRLRPEEKRRLRDEYINASSEQKKVLEQRYGKRQLQQLVDNMLSQEWMESNSKNCPHCCAPIEKSDGCNKMTCWRCGTYFCWLCMSKLNGMTPYMHYNTPGSPCFNQLFQGVVEPEDENDDWEFGQFL